MTSMIKQDSPDWFVAINDMQFRELQDTVTQLRQLQSINCPMNDAEKQNLIALYHLKVHHNKTLLEKFDQNPEKLNLDKELLLSIAHMYRTLRELDLIYKKILSLITIQPNTKAVINAQQQQIENPSFESLLDELIKRNS